MTSANSVTPISFAGLTHTGQYTDSNPYGVAMVAAYVKKSFGDSVDIGLIDGGDQPVAFFDIIDAETLQLNTHQDGRDTPG